MNTQQKSHWKIFLIIIAGILVAGLTFLILFFTHQPITEEISDSIVETPIETPAAEEPETPTSDLPSTEISDCTQNFTTNWQYLMLINPNFTVSTDWIASRKTELIDISATYGINEGLAGNGQPLLDAVAAEHLNQMAQDYKSLYPGHELTTRSCFRSVGTSCGRLCYATGTSDHHSGYTCDLIDDYYGESLDTDLYGQHPEWQWLHENSYKYGFIDRFVENWAGGSMSEPVNVDTNGTTGLYETWHYRYVGLTAAEEIATGKYNNGVYDSLEHYLKATGRLTNLLNPSGNCQS
jgi:LAS superfamily LD-carboxypeptidase LdcB